MKWLSDIKEFFKRKKRKEEILEINFCLGNDKYSEELEEFKDLVYGRYFGITSPILSALGIELKKIVIYVGKIFKKYPDEERFLKRFTLTMEHEILHKVICEELGLKAKNFKIEKTLWQLEL